MRGKIVKAIAGFYYVDAVESGIYKCRAKGIFRKEGLKPLVGDIAEMEVTHEGDKEGNVTEILPRKNELARPAVANVDQVLILMAITHPSPNYVLLDRFLISAEMRGVPCTICINKTDVSTEEQIEEIRAVYADCGHPLYFLSVKEEKGIETLRALLKDKTTVLAGPSGVGKSSLTNLMAGEDRMEIGEISKKLARGKNTTRHTELHEIGPNTYLCDTPGFSAFDTEEIEKEDLRSYYREFQPYEGTCRFQGCVHVGEPGCAVKDALAEGAFSRIRYDNYVYLFEELKEAERRRYL